jgi:hypothetical protein
VTSSGGTWRGFFGSDAATSGKLPARMVEVAVQVQRNVRTLSSRFFQAVSMSSSVAVECSSARTDPPEGNPNVATIIKQNTFV